jgi:hypothetical protein
MSSVRVILFRAAPQRRNNTTLRRNRFHQATKMARNQHWLAFAEFSRKWTTPMLAEKFMLLLETLRSQAQAADGSRRVVSSSPHVPVRLPSDSAKPR